MLKTQIFIEKHATSLLLEMRSTDNIYDMENLTAPPNTYAHTPTMNGHFEPLETGLKVKEGNEVYE